MSQPGSPIIIRPIPETSTSLTDNPIAPEPPAHKRMAALSHGWTSVGLLGRRRASYRLRRETSHIEVYDIAAAR